MFVRARSAAIECDKTCHIRRRPAGAIASNHLVDGKYTNETVERELRHADYEAETVRHADGEWITYGRPRAAIAR